MIRPRLVPPRIWPIIQSSALALNHGPVFRRRLFGPLAVGVVVHRPQPE
jgi:hypothetical protein